MNEPLDESIGENKGNAAHGFNRIAALARCVVIAMALIEMVQSAIYSFSFGKGSGALFAFLAGLIVASSFKLLFLYYNFRHAKVEFKSELIIPQFRRPFIIVFIGYLIYSIIDNFQMIGMYVDYELGIIHIIAMAVLLIAEVIILRQEFKYLGVRQVRK